MDRIVGLEVFVKVVEGGSFASAARHFRLSPAMVSKHVQALEERLGARLLNRTTRRVSPTEVGQGYYERCVRILAELAEADHVAGDLQTTPRGLLKVSAPVTFGSEHVAAPIAEYLAKYPDVSVDLTLNDHCVDLLDEGFDLAIRVGQLSDSSLIARRLTAVRMVLCAAPEYVERRGEPRTPHDLAAHNCLDFSSSSTRDQWTFVGPGGNKEAISPVGRFRANNVNAVRRFALGGEGIVLEPSFIVAQDLKAGRLIPLLRSYRVADIPIHAVYPHSRFLSAKVRTFVDFLAAELNRQGEGNRMPEAVALEDRNVAQRFRVAA
jgi:DNA-binding transcriptional LysR family regulator